MDWIRKKRIVLISLLAFCIGLGVGLPFFTKRIYADSSSSSWTVDTETEWYDNSSQDIDVRTSITNEELRLFGRDGHSVYSFDSQDGEDLTSNNRDGTVNGGSFVDTDFGYGFDGGSSDWFDVPNDYGFMADGDFSIFFQMDWDSYDGANNFLDFRRNAWIIIQKSDDDGMKVRIHNEGGDPKDVLYSGSLNLEQTYDLAVVRDYDVGYSLYVDGEEVDTSDDTGTHDPDGSWAGSGLFATYEGKDGFVGTSDEVFFLESAVGENFVKRVHDRTSPSSMTGSDLETGVWKSQVWDPDGGNRMLDSVELSSSVGSSENILANLTVYDDAGNQIDNTDWTNVNDVSTWEPSVEDGYQYSIDFKLQTDTTDSSPSVNSFSVNTSEGREWNDVDDWSGSVSNKDVEYLWYVNSSTGTNIFKYTMEGDYADDNADVSSESIPYSIHKTPNKGWIMGGNQTVYEYGSDWNYTGESHDLDNTSEMGGIEFFDNKWYVTDSTDDEIDIYDSNWSFVESETLYNPEALVREGDRWYVITSQYNIYIYDTSWDKVDEHNLSSNIGFAYGIDVSENGDFWLSGEEDSNAYKRIFHYDSDWNYIEEFSISTSDKYIRGLYVEKPGPSWRNKATISGEISNSTTWDDVESWSGTLEVANEWHDIESWSDFLTNTASWVDIESWSNVKWTEDPTEGWEVDGDGQKNLEYTEDWYTIGENSIHIWEPYLNSYGHWVEATKDFDMTNIENFEVDLRIELKGTTDGSATAELYVGEDKVFSETQHANEWRKENFFAYNIDASSYSGMTEVRMYVNGAYDAGYHLFLDNMTAFSTTIQAPTEWNDMENWTGNVGQVQQWENIESISGNVQDISNWGDKVVWSAEVLNVTKWTDLEDWTGKVEESTTWNDVDEWNGDISNISEWYDSKSWTGQINNISNWNDVGNWAGDIKVVEDWHDMERWSGSLIQEALWTDKATLSGEISNSAMWRDIEIQTGTIKVSEKWHDMEIWQGTIEEVTDWNDKSTLTGQITETSSKWNDIENWAGLLTGAGEWHDMEVWGVDITSPADWRDVQILSGEVSEGESKWNDIAQWQGNLKELLQWYDMEKRSGQLNNTAVWGNKQSISGEVRTVKTWNDIKSWSGSLYGEKWWHDMESMEGHITTDIYYLTINVSGEGTTTPEAGTYGYNAGEVVKITTKPEEGYQFENWTGDYFDEVGGEDLQTSEFLEIKMYDNREITAHFTEVDYNKLGLVLSLIVVIFISLLGIFYRPLFSLLAGPGWLFIAIQFFSEINSASFFIGLAFGLILLYRGLIEGYIE